MPARDDLDRIEATTDWPALVALALGTPPNPSRLLAALNSWAASFRFAERGEPLEADYPDPVRQFFQRLALADYPPALWEWLIAFKIKRGRPAGLKEIPKRLRDMIPKSKRGRQRCDTRQFRTARSAWEVAVFHESYELRHTVIKLFRRCDNVSNCFGFDKVSMRGDSPSNLAIEKLALETGLSVSRLDQMGIRRRK